ncbi:hypothetical protein ABIE26_002983 [Pedobacter africanus]|uniref:toprim domain-containing protein n=1 Tax=Pedobacter africanus TaxID=151894 RepID=UPI00339613C8
MENRNERLTCKEVREFDLVDFLAGLGHLPVKVRGYDYWYLSPLREEKTASFKVNRKINRWFDFQLWQGGDLIAFATRYHNCTVGDFLRILSVGGARSAPLRTFPPPPPKADDTPAIKITYTSFISDPDLLHYLYQRRIPTQIADTHCVQATFVIGEKTYNAIAFKNDLGGYELRNSWFKGSTAPKAVTTIRCGAGISAAVFEGFFDMLSYLALIPHPDPDQDLVVLNGLGMIPTLRHRTLYLFLDRDEPGRIATLKLCGSSAAVKDCSDLYRNHKDLNDFLCHFGKSPDFPKTTTSQD